MMSWLTDGKDFSVRIVENESFEKILDTDGLIRSIDIYLIG